MYAVIKTGAHQYIVRPGDVLKVDKLASNPGDSVTFENVLLASHEEGKLETDPEVLSKYRVEGIVKKQMRDPKILVFKYKRRKNHKKLRGHKQPVSEIEITQIKKS